VSQAGAIIRHQGIGRWWDAVPKNRWPDSPEFEEALRMHWTKDYGDRRQEIVFIGLKDEMDEAAIRKKLDDCLVKDYLVAPDVFQKLKDPFPGWFQEAA
ncbi:MAG: GTP-binding protein, partial [Pseudomonadota bacterium]